MNDTFGDRIKSYEIDQPLLSDYIIARLDGKGFSRLCRSHNIKTFNNDLCQVFTEISTSLLKFANAKLCYTQSDEITVVLAKPHDEAQHLFDGKPQKLCSVLSSFVTLEFNRSRHNPFKVPAYFDCRVFAVPSLIEAANAVLWRVQDCVRNSISNLAMQHFSHKDLDGMSTKDRVIALENKNIIWDQQDQRFKYGGFTKFITDPSGRKITLLLHPPVKPDFQAIKNMLEA